MLIPKNLAKRILKKMGAKRISKSAQIELAKSIEEYSFKLAKLAIKNAEYLGRSTVKKEDVKKDIII